MNKIPTNSRKEDTGSVNEVTTSALATLATLTPLLVNGPTMTRGGGIISTRGALGVRSLTISDGPFIVGIANKDLTLAELEEYLEAFGPTHPDDTTLVERTSRGRKIRILGVVVPSGDGSQGAIHLSDLALSGLRFTEETSGWSWWIYNLGKAMTSGAIFFIAMQSFVRWNRSG